MGEKPRSRKARDARSATVHLVLQNPRDKDFGAWQFPRVRDLVAAAIQPSEEEIEDFKAITIRPTVQEVALLDALSELFNESRNVTARRLLVAAMREALDALPDAKRSDVQARAFKLTGWGLLTPEKIREVNGRGARGETTPLSVLAKPPQDV